MRRRTIMVLTLLVFVALLVALRYLPLERILLFYPSHHSPNNSLTPWVKNGEIIGYARKIESPKNVWLMLHGNAGQASDRLYAVPCFSSDDSVFILEYPGYGDRNGIPSKETFNRAAQEAYLFLKETYPHLPVCVVAESIGSGPASSLAGLAQKPDKFVFIVPFDKLSSVGADHFPSILVYLILRSNWDNITALSNYKGPIDIFGAEADTIIPVRHAKALGAALPTAKLTIIEGGHNDWSFEGRVQIRNP